MRCNCVRWKNIGPVGEFDLIRKYFARRPVAGAELGIGDDCALLGLRAGAGASLAISTDMLVAGRHFFADVLPRALGHKAIAVNLSDLAAMGARPRAFTLALALPEIDEPWLDEFSQGLFALADRHGCELIGGDTTQGPLNICITVFGDCNADTALRRDHAQPGDDVWVSGELGGAHYSVRERYAGRSLPPGHGATRRAEWPTPRVELGLALRHLAKAAIDISDGLVGDLGHIADRSRAGIELRWTTIPFDTALAGLGEDTARMLALNGGDDYELAFCAASENRVAIESLSAGLELRLSRIGSVHAGSGVSVVDDRGARVNADFRSFDHFA